MQELHVLLTFTGGLAAALILGFISQRLKLSPIVGYLLAGIAVGPFTPGFTAHQPVAEQFAEIGVILLMFGIGLRFHLRELAAVWRIAVPGAFIQSAFFHCRAGLPAAGPGLGVELRNRYGPCDLGGEHGRDGLCPG